MPLQEKRFCPMETLEKRERLARLTGHLCPLCSAASRLFFDGTALYCFAGHGWSNPDAAEADIVTQRPRPMAEQHLLLARKPRRRVAGPHGRCWPGSKRPLGTGWLPRPLPERRNRRKRRNRSWKRVKMKTKPRRPNPSRTHSSPAERALPSPPRRWVSPTGTHLTRREIEICQLAAQGLETQKIAQVLFVGIRTIEFHKNNIRLKTGTHSTLEALAKLGRWEFNL